MTDNFYINPQVPATGGIAVDGGYLKFSFRDVESCLAAASDPRLAGRTGEDLVEGVSLLYKGKLKRAVYSDANLAECDGPNDAPAIREWHETGALKKVFHIVKDGPVYRFGDKRGEYAIREWDENGTLVKASSTPFVNGEWGPARDVTRQAQRTETFN